MKFPDLIAQISKIDEIGRLAAGRTLQQILSLRNWLMGASVVEFEQAGEDRAQYVDILPRLKTRDSYGALQAARSCS
jgi:hypothetical protein